MKISWTQLMNIISCFDKLFQTMSQEINSNKSIETSLVGSWASSMEFAVAKFRVVSSDMNNSLACEQEVVWIHTLIVLFTVEFGQVYNGMMEYCVIISNPRFLTAYIDTLNFCTFDLQLENSSHKSYARLECWTSSFTVK